MKVERRGSTARWSGWACLGAVLAPARAEAHSAIPGMSEWVSGVLHPLLTPLHLLVLLSVGLWTGQQSPLRLKYPLVVFGLCAGAGLLGTLAARFPQVAPPYLLAASLGAGVLVALVVPLRMPAAALLFAYAGFITGLDSAADGATSSIAIAKTLFGSWLGLTVAFVNVAYYTSLCPPRPWVQTAIRIAASWIVAISLLMLAFALRKE